MRSIEVIVHHRVRRGYQQGTEVDRREPQAGTAFGELMAKSIEQLGVLPIGEVDPEQVQPKATADDRGEDLTSRRVRRVDILPVVASAAIAAHREGLEPRARVAIQESDELLVLKQIEQVHPMSGDQGAKPEVAAVCFGEIQHLVHHGHAPRLDARRSFGAPGLAKSL
jgi:hypothetical protein